MEPHLPADSPEKFRFRAESLRSASAGKQAHKGQRQTPSPQDSLFLQDNALRFFARAWLL